jgi:hypothetical protein
MKEFKLLRGYVYGDYTLPIARRGAGRTIANELLLTPRTRECAVIASSVRDFNNWRTMTFERNNVFIITNRDFLHTNGVSGIPTRYRSISRIDDCRGLTFDDYITTDRIEDILSSVFDDTIDHIRQLIVEVNLHTRDERL